MTSVTASDGVTLAVHRYTEVDPQRPTILAIHGYPDNHHVWDGVAERLGQRFNVVAYDVRGAGESSCPAGRSGYRLPQLISDIGAVIDSLGAGRVHLLAHDWGSIQAWAAVTDESTPPDMATTTRVSAGRPSISRLLRIAVTISTGRPRRHGRRPLAARPPFKSGAAANFADRAQRLPPRRDGRPS